MNATPEITLGSFNIRQTEGVGKLNIIIDGAGTGDTDENIGVITPERRKQLADVYRRDYFDGVHIRLDLYRYLHYFYIDEDMPAYYNVNHVQELYDMGVIGPDNPEYMQILTQVRYSVTNQEMAQLLGFILISTDMMSLAKEKGITVKLVFENPLHQIGNPHKLLGLLEIMRADAQGVIGNQHVHA